MNASDAGGYAVPIRRTPFEFLSSIAFPFAFAVSDPPCARASARWTAAMALSTSRSDVLQFTTLTRIARMPRQVVVEKNASPSAFTAATILPVQLS